MLLESKGHKVPPGESVEDELKFLDYKLNAPSQSEETIATWFTYSDDDTTKADITGLSEEGKKQTVLYFPNKNGVKLAEFINMSGSNAKEIYINSKLNFNLRRLNFAGEENDPLEELYIDREDEYSNMQVTFNAINLKKVIFNNMAFKNYTSAFFVHSNNIESIKFLGLSENIYQENGNIIIIKREISGVEEYCLFAATKHLKNISEKVTYISADIFSKSKNLDQEEIVLKKVRRIGSSAFYHSNLKSIKLNDGLRIIGGSAFTNTDLEAISIPASVDVVGARILKDCKNLKRITVHWSGESKPDGWSDDWKEGIPDGCEIVNAG